MATFFSTVISAMTSIIIGGAAMADLSTPESAIRTLEDAFKNRDIEGAVNAKDFVTEALLMLRRINPDMARDPEVLKETAKVLELGFRKEIETDGFPDFTGLSCSLSKPVEVEENLVKVVETCIDSLGARSTHNLHVFRSAKGWRIVVAPE